MYRKVILCLLVVLLSAVTAAAQEMSKDKESEAEEATSTAPEMGKDRESKAEAVMAAAQEVKDKESEAKELSGMSIVGNDEAPKSLYIVPWKSSEIGMETSLDTMLNEGDVPVDRDVFMRQLRFYQISTTK